MFPKALPSLPSCTPLYKRHSAFNSRYSRTTPRYIVVKGTKNQLSSTFREHLMIDELGRWFRTWRLEVKPDKSAAIKFKYNKRRSLKIVDLHTFVC
ncbi:hypothetical protein EVAR_6916_1 [Eumeta japonica]|uniref:RNA-directed DNA polymerase from mobile element jockey n=1 Tax=Eumeta variegata TaxID=151549 RepID=A0A4C1TJV1_EUMVA|nr:hypothetical protein EVAR_6916_1 [Eumeta japonica]